MGFFFFSEGINHLFCDTLLCRSHSLHSQTRGGEGGGGLRCKQYLILISKVSTAEVEAITGAVWLGCSSQFVNRYMKWSLSLSLSLSLSALLCSALLCSGCTEEEESLMCVGIFLLLLTRGCGRPEAVGGRIWDLGEFGRSLFPLSTYFRKCSLGHDPNRNHEKRMFLFTRLWAAHMLSIYGLSRIGLIIRNFISGYNGCPKCW